MELGHFNKHFLKNTTKTGTAGKDFGVFSPRYSQKCILNGEFNPTMEIIRAFFFQNQGTFFDFQKRAGEVFQFDPSCAPVNVAEYALISLNIPKYS